MALLHVLPKQAANPLGVRSNQSKVRFILYTNTECEVKNMCFKNFFDSDNCLCTALVVAAIAFIICALCCGCDD